MNHGVEPKLPTPPPLPERGEEDEDIDEEERQRRKHLEYGEEDEDAVRSDQDSEAGGGPQQMITHEERIAQVPLANLAVPAGGKVWHAKLPNFLGLETQAWNEENWQPEDNEGESQQASQQESSQGGEDVKPNIGGKSGKGHLPDENVIRWRWTKDELGQVVSFLTLSLPFLTSADLVSPDLDQAIQRSYRSMVRRFPLPPTRFRTLRHLSRSRPLCQHLSSTEPRRAFFLADRSHPYNLRRQPRSRSHLSHRTTRLQSIVRSASVSRRNDDVPTIDLDFTNPQEVGRFCRCEVRCEGQRNQDYDVGD